MLRAIDNKSAAGIASDASVHREVLRNLRAKKLAPAWIAVTELVGARRCNPTPDIACQAAQQFGIGVGMPKRKGPALRLLNFVFGGGQAHRRGR
jgi:hypothetical protein